MKKITLKIEGMACPRCEARINSVITERLSPVSVVSSHTKKTCVITVNEDVEDTLLKTLIEDMGFTLIEITREDHVKKGLFGFLRK